MRMANAGGMIQWKGLQLFAHAQARRQRWDLRNVVGAMLLLLVGIWVRWTDWKDIWNIYTRDEEASHVILTPIVVLALVWVRRERLRKITLRTSWLGPIVVAAGCFICYFGEGHGYQAMRHFGAVTIAVGCLVTMLGREFLVNFAPAFAALAFLIPMPPLFRQKISLPLEGINATMTEEILLALGVPVTRSGNQLNINGINISIVEACNGLRLFFTICMVSYLVAFMMSLKGYVRILLLALSPLVSIVCNVFRLIVTAYMYGYMSKELGDASHEIAGWVMIPTAFAVLYTLVWALKWALVPVSPFTLARD